MLSELKLAEDEKLPVPRSSSTSSSVQLPLEEDEVVDAYEISDDIDILPVMPVIK